MDDNNDSGEENLDGILSQTLIPPSNVPVPTTSKQPLNQENCYTYLSYGMNHNEKNASDTEPNSWQDKSLNDLYRHLIEMSTRRHNGLIVGDCTIKSIFKQIHERRALSAIIPQYYLAYTSLLKLTTRPGVPDIMYNKIVNRVSNLCSLNTNNRNLSACYSKPSRTVVSNWIADIVHIKYQFLKASQYFQERLQLPSGRKVILTKNNIKYQLAMLFSDENLMVTQNFVFPDKHDPTVLPTFDKCRLGENNNGLFCKDTDFALKKIEYHERSLPLNAAEIQQLASSPPKVIIPFQLFIDGTLVARNSVEPISICPGIFNRSVRNLARSWFIMGYIEPEKKSVEKSMRDSPEEEVRRNLK